MGLEIEYKDGETPLDEDEKEGLLLPTVTTRGELDEVEQRNIEEAVRWTVQRRKKFTIDEVLSEGFVKKLHRRMFGQVWRWAGSFRNSNKNIGVDKHQIGTHLRMLLDDCRYWILNSVYTPDEIAVRFKHRIVCIHCFANGNGRHSRLMADVVAKALNVDVFTWGSRELIHRPEYRTDYLHALRKADIGEFDKLLHFARA